MTLRSFTFAAVAGFALVGVGCPESADSSAEVPVMPVLVGFEPASPAANPTPTASGVGTPGTIVELFAGADCAGERVAETTIEASGVFAVAVSAEPNAQSTFSALARGASGASSDCSAAVTYVHDDVAPQTPTLSAVSPGSPSNVNRRLVTGTAEAESVVSLYADATCAGPPLGQGDASTLSGAGISVWVADDTSNFLYAAAMDAAGNVSPCTSDALTIVEDSTPPSVPVISGVTPPGPSDALSVLLTGSADADATVFIHDGSGCGPATLLAESPGTTLTDGVTVTVAADTTTTFFLRGTDAAGNATACVNSGVSYTHGVDAPPGLDPPSLILQETDGASLSVVLVGTTAPGATVDFFADGNCGGSAIDSVAANESTGGYSATVTLPNSGLNAATTFTVQASLGAGLVSGCSQQVVYNHDDVVPQAPVLTQVAPPTATMVQDTIVNGSGEAGAEVRLYWNVDCEGSVLATGVVTEGGSFAIDVTFPIEAVSTIYAHQVDAAGNVSACSNSVVFVHDPGAPSGSVVALELGLTDGVVVTNIQDDVTPGALMRFEVCVATSPHGCSPFIVTETLEEPLDGTFSWAGLAEDTRYFVWGRPVDAAGNVGNVSGPVTARTQITNRVLDLTMGYGHSCVLTLDRHVACFGDDSTGQLGTPGPAQNLQAAATIVDGLEDVTSIAAGQGHTCAVTTAGKAYCWGRNDYGQTGVPVSDLSVPNQVQFPGYATRVVTGRHHSCAVAGDQSVRCWGRGDLGQMGDGLLSDSTFPVETMWFFFPLNIYGPLTAGAHGACSLQGGRMRCWGDGSAGQLGADYPAGNVPENVGKSTTVATNVNAIAMGEAHTCLVKQGEVLCLGDNSAGQLGGGVTEASTDTPTVVPGIAGAKAVAAGGLHSCALTSDGAVWCWGDNSHGQLGDGTTEPSATPTQVLGGHTFVKLMARGDATCGLTGSSQAWCWGDNGQGQLGLGAASAGDQLLPKLLLIPPSTARFHAVSAGSGVSAGIATTGTLWLWGRRDDGLAGDATPGEPSPEPVAPLAGVADVVQSVEFGDNHACALTDTGAIWCWGSNANGQINGLASAELLPPTLIPAPPAVELDLGADHACAIVNGGADVVCWGDNSLGALGAGITVPIAGAYALGQSASAIAIGGSTSFIVDDHLVAGWGTGDLASSGTGLFGVTFIFGNAVDIVVGDGFNCSPPDNGGGPRCWGFNSAGQLAVAPEANLPFTVVPALEAAERMVFGATHACGVFPGPLKIRCWGGSTQGQLGTGTSLPVSTDPLPLGTAFVDVAAGNNHTCLLDKGGAIHCTGGNESLQLGSPTNNELSALEPIPGPLLP